TVHTHFCIRAPLCSVWRILPKSSTLINNWTFRVVRRALGSSYYPFSGSSYYPFSRSIDSTYHFSYALILWPRRARKILHPGNPHPPHGPLGSWSAWLHCLKATILRRGSSASFGR